MKNIKQTLQDLGDRDALHRFVDGLPEDVRVLILVDGPQGSSYYNTLGRPSLERLLWMVKSYERWLLDPEGD